jgi:hypothetical protein
MDDTLAMIGVALLFFGFFLGAVGLLWYMVGRLLILFGLNIRRGIGVMVMLVGIVMSLGACALMSRLTR